MKMWAWLVGGIIVLQYAFFGYLYIHKNYIRPFLYYKLVVYDNDDEFTFHRKKKQAVIIENKKGYVLFKKKNNEGEFYNIPLDRKNDGLMSKRDDFGTITYYYFRNNTNPISIQNTTGVSLINDSSFMSKILKTKIINSSVLSDKKEIRINWYLIVGAVVVMLIIIFHKDIARLLGV